LTTVFPTDNPTLTLRQYLEQPVPDVLIEKYGYAMSRSSSVNSKFGGIFPIDFSSITEGNGDVYDILVSRCPALAFNPTPIDYSLRLKVESDAINAMRHYIITPVNIALQRMHIPHLTTYSEDSRTVDGRDLATGENVKLITRLDMSWSSELVKFAFLEYKRVGVLRY
jgi:hypothetical protein